MKRHFWLMVVLGIWGEGAQARPIRTLDMDALVYSSDSVIEGEIESTKTENYDVAASLRVEKSLLGADLSGQKITLPYLGLYRKGREWIRYSRLETRSVAGKTTHAYVPMPEKNDVIEPLSAGDHLICFLDQRLWPLSVKLIRGEEVSGFQQWGNPGGLREVRGVPRATFEASLRESVTRVGEFKTRLKQRDPNSADYFLSWVQGRSADKIRWFGTDAIRRAALMALVDAQSWPELTRVLELAPDSDHSLVVSAFNCPGGRNFLLGQLADADETRSRRLQWVRVLQENVGIQSKVFGGEKEDGGDLLRRVSHLALENRADAGLASEFVRIAARFLQRATGNGWNVPKTLRVENEAALHDLQLLRAQTRFPALQKQVDVVLALARRSN